MRVGDRYRFEMFKHNIQKVQGNIEKATEQIASGRKINKPSDDPVIFSRVIEINAEKSLNSQFSRNLERLQTLGSMYESSFTSIHDILSEAQSVAIAMANDTVDAASRKAAAQEIKDIIERLVLIGNTKLTGTYIFGGKDATTSPLKLNSDYTVDLLIPYGAEEAISTYVSQGELMKAGFSVTDAFYDRQKVLYQSPDNGFDGGVFLNGSYYGFVIDGSNNTLVYNDGTGADIEVGLDDGIYKGQELASKIQERLGSGYTVLYDSSARRFEITNNTKSTVTFKWQASSIAATLGFHAVDSEVASGESSKSDYDAFAKSFVLKATTSGATSGPLDGRARYRYSLDGGITWSDEEIIVNYGLYSPTETASYVVDKSNNTLYENGVAITLSSGRYTGEGLASEIEDELNDIQPGHTVTYDPTARRFTITNNTGSDITLNWSMTGATAGGLLGFDSKDMLIGNGTATTGTQEAGLSMGVVMDVDDKNNTIYRNGIAITIEPGTYTAEGLAKTIEDKLNDIQPGYTVTYDAATGKFSITNNTGVPVVFNWSMNSASDSSIGGLLGFDTIDSYITNGSSAISAFQAGMFIDGSNTINQTNNRLKVTFEQSKEMIKEDTFKVEDMTIFQMLKDLMDSLENNNGHGIRVAIDNLDYALDHAEENISYIGTFNSKIETLTTEKEDKDYTLNTVVSKMVSADITELATEYTMLQTMYQALLYSIAKMQNLSLLNYL